MVKKYQIYFTHQAEKDAKKISAHRLKQKVEKLLEIISHNPYQSPPPYEKLIGDLKGLISRRINIQHRLVYQVFEKEQAIKILRMWTHYD